MAAMSEDKLTSEYHKKLRENAHEFDELAGHKRKLEGLMQLIYEWKQQDIAYLDRLRCEMNHDNTTSDRCMIDDMIFETQQMGGQAEQSLEQECEEIENKCRRLREQEETYHSEYKRAMEETRGKGATT